MKRSWGYFLKSAINWFPCLWTHPSCEQTNKQNRQQIIVNAYWRCGATEGTLRAPIPTRCSKSILDNTKVDNGHLIKRCFHKQCDLVCSGDCLQIILSLKIVFGWHWPSTLSFQAIVAVISFGLVEMAFGWHPPGNSATLVYFVTGIWENNWATF